MDNYHHVLVDAKTEYTKQLVTMLTPRIYEGISSIYEYARENYGKNCLLKFELLIK